MKHTPEMEILLNAPFDKAKFVAGTSAGIAREQGAMQGVPPPPPPPPLAAGSDGSIEAAFLAGFEAGERSEQFRTGHRSGMSLHTAEEALALWRNGARQ